MTIKQTNYNGTPVQYAVQGTGEPLVMLHGFAEDRKIWEMIADPLAGSFQLIMPDLPGSGASPMPEGQISIELLADSVYAVLEAENIRQCTMIGHSMGGYITLAFAEKYPDRLNRLGLFHSTAFADSEEKKKTRHKNMEFIRQHGSAKFIQQSVPTLFAPPEHGTTVTDKTDIPQHDAVRSSSKDSPQSTEHKPNPKRQLIGKIIDTYSNFSPDSLVQYTRAMAERPDRTAVLKSFKGPVLIILGEHDTAVPIDQGLKLGEIPGFVYIYICTRSGHMGMLEEPDFCISSIKDFCSTIPDSPAR